jgi:aerobic-type carbon monoxide dehydrogenase small subunit (CoxS/CutS family)
MSNMTLKVNGSSHTVDIDPTTPLLYILRNDLGLQGPYRRRGGPLLHPACVCR